MTEYFLIVTKRDHEPEEMKMVTTEREVINTVANISAGMIDATPDHRKYIVRIMKIDTQGRTTLLEVVFQGTLKLKAIPLVVTPRICPHCESNIYE